MSKNNIPKTLSPEDQDMVADVIKRLNKTGIQGFAFDLKHTTPQQVRAMVEKKLGGHRDDN